MPDPNSLPPEEAKRILENMERIMVIGSPRIRINAPMMKRIVERQMVGTIIFKGIMSGELPDSWWWDVIAEYFTAQ